MLLQLAGSTLSKCSKTAFSSKRQPGLLKHFSRRVILSKVLRQEVNHLHLYKLATPVTNASWING